MKKKTVVIVSVSLVLAILAIAVISTFPTYIFETPNEPASTNPEIQSGNITESADDTIDIGSSNGIEAVLPGIDEADTEQPVASNKSYNTLAENSGAKLLAENGAFEKGTVFAVDKLGIFNKMYYRARYYVRDFADKYAMYEITAKNGGKNVSPIGEAKVIIDIPNNYDLDKTEIYFLISDNRVTKLNCSIDKTNRTAVVSFTQSGVYVIIEKSVDQDKNASSENSGSNSSQTSNSESQTSSNSSSDSSSNTSSGNTSDNSSSTGSDNDQTQSDTSSSTDSSNPDTPSEPDTPVESNPEWETMDGWLPWY